MRKDDKDNQQLENDLLDLVAEEAMVERSVLSASARLDELDIASADFVMILMAIEEKFDVYISVDSEMSDMQTVQDLLDLAAKKIAEKDA